MLFSGHLTVTAEWLKSETPLICNPVLEISSLSVIKPPGFKMNQFVTVDFLVIVDVVLCPNPGSEVPPPFAEAASRRHFDPPGVIFSVHASF